MWHVSCLQQPPQLIVHQQSEPAIIVKLEETKWNLLVHVVVVVTRLTARLLEIDNARFDHSCFIVYNSFPIILTDYVDVARQNDGTRMRDSKTQPC